MTEITDNNEGRPAHFAARFLLALLGAPVLLALLGAALAGIDRSLGAMTIAAAPMGAPSYLLVGAPFLLFGAAKGWRSPLAFAALGFTANLAAAPLLAAVMLISGEPWPTTLDSVRFISGFGLIFAPIFGALFGALFALSPRRLPIEPPSWTRDRRAPLLLILAPFAAGGLVAGGALLLQLAFAAQSGPVAPDAPALWREIVTHQTIIAAISAPAFLGLRLLARRAAIEFGLTGGAVAAIAVLLRSTLEANSEPDFSPLWLVIAIAYMLALRRFAGAAGESAS